MDLAAHQRLVTLTGGRIARAWNAAWQHVREVNPPEQFAARLYTTEPLIGVKDALAAYGAQQHGAYLSGAMAATQWLGRQLQPPAPVRKKLLAFNPAGDDVLTWAERNRLDKIVGHDLETRSLVRAALIEMQDSGRNPKAVAREIWESLGLTPAQEEIVQNYRRQLEGQQYNAALERELSSGASDRAIAAAARANRAMTPEQIDTAVSRYRQNFQRLRAETILRTEGARVANQAQDEAFRQAIASGAVDADQLEQTWYHSPKADSKHERTFHREMHGQTRPWGEPFISGLGNELAFPCDPDAPAEETVNCRCARAVRVARN